MLGVANCLNKKSPVFTFACASLIHFGALPIATLLFFVTRRRLDPKVFLGAAAVGVLFVYYLANLSLFDFYLDTLRYKVEAYATKNDGDVTFVQEVRLPIYWSAAVLIFAIIRSPIAVGYILIYLAYLVTFQNDLYHLRYHKFLEAMAWPSAFIFFFIKREASSHLVLSALCYRVYKYISLLSPESGARPMLTILLLSFLSLMSALFV
jgi:hypothetical protein